MAIADECTCDWKKPCPNHGWSDKEDYPPLCFSKELREPDDELPCEECKWADDCDKD